MIAFLYKSDILPKVTLCGSVAIEGHNKHFKRKPLEYILYYIISGEMKIKEGKNTYLLTKGDTILLDPTRVHEGILTPSDVSYYYVHFTTQDIQELNSDNDMIEEQHIMNLVNKDNRCKLVLPKYIHIAEHNNEAVTILFNKLLSAYTQNQLYTDTLMNCYFLELLTIIAKNMAKPAPYVAENKHDLVIHILDYIHANCRTKLTSKDVEAHFHMNFDYLNRQFKKKTGMTICYYSNRYRIQESKKLLQSGLYNIRQKAEMMGFSNEFYFSRIYKNFEGKAPSKWMKQ